MINDIREYTATSLYRAKIKINVVQPKPQGPVNAGNSNISENTSARNSSHIGRNDMCPCGSGKKYKNCCMNKENK